MRQTRFSGMSLFSRGKQCVGSEHHSPLEWSFFRGSSQSPESHYCSSTSEGFGSRAPPVLKEPHTRWSEVNIWTWHRPAPAFGKNNQEWKCWLASVFWHHLFLVCWDIKDKLESESGGSPFGRAPDTQPPFALDFLAQLYQAAGWHLPAASSLVLSQEWVSAPPLWLQSLSNSTSCVKLSDFPSWNEFLPDLYFICFYDECSEHSTISLFILSVRMQVHDGSVAGPGLSCFFAVSPVPWTVPDT